MTTKPDTSKPITLGLLEFSVTVYTMPDKMRAAAAMNRNPPI
jgi:hypothetical protein